MAITRIEGKTVRRSLTKPTPWSVHVDDDDLDVARAGRREGEGLVEAGLRDDARAGARESGLDDGLRVLLAGEHDLDLARASP